MGKWIKRILIIIALAVFLFSAGSILFIMYRYKINDEIYSNAANQFTTPVNDSGGKEAAADVDGDEEEEIETAPISVDFESLLAVNSDIIGWIYCEDTPINYPVLQGKDNNTYLRHTYEGEYNVDGSIFVEAENRPGFVDSNTVIYGHHMKSGSMFAALEKWKEQEFYDEHPFIWLLTPEQDYKIVLFSGYWTSAYSDTYTIFRKPCEELDEYLVNSIRQSDFKADVELDPEGHYILLTTCAYVFDNARYVIHGFLVPVGGQQVVQAGGIHT